MSARILIILTTAMLAFGVAAQVAQAQAQPGGQRTVEPLRSTVVKTHPHYDRVETQPGNKPMALLFWAFAAATVGGALFVVTRRNLITAVMGMVGSFLGIAAIYMMLYAHFLSVIQLLVYAGAIMVLFVFVIMILNRPEDEPVAPSRRIGAVIAGVAILYLVGRLIMMLIKVQPPNPAKALAAPAPVPLRSGELADWGGVKAVGTDLFGPGIFPFEAISITLLVAIVGAIAIARPMRDDEPLAAPASEDERLGIDRTHRDSKP